MAYSWMEEGREVMEKINYGVLKVITIVLVNWFFEQVGNIKDTNAANL